MHHPLSPSSFIFAWDKLRPPTGFKKGKEDLKLSAGEEEEEEEERTLEREFAREKTGEKEKLSDG